MRVRKLGLVVALWGREELARLCLRRVARAARAQKVILVAVTDEPINGRMARSLGYEVVEHSNRPLSDKHNAGALHLRDRVDALVVMGSDNWVCDSFFPTWHRELQRHRLVGVTDAWQVSMHTRQALYFPGYRDPRRGGESLGVGRALRRDVLSQLDWKPWQSGLNRGLDWSMRTRLESVGCFPTGRPQATYKVRTLGLKSKHALTPFRAFRQNPHTRLVERDVALAPFPVDEIADLDRYAGAAPAEPEPQDPPTLQDELELELLRVVDSFLCGASDAATPEIGAEARELLRGESRDMFLDAIRQRIVDRAAVRAMALSEEIVSEAVDALFARNR